MYIVRISHMICVCSQSIGREEITSTIVSTIETMELKTLFIFIGDYCFREFMVNDKRQSVKTIEMINSEQ